MNATDPEVTKALADAWQQDAEDWQDVADELATSFKEEIDELVQMLRAMIAIARRYTNEAGPDDTAICAVEDHLEWNYLREYVE